MRKATFEGIQMALSDQLTKLAARAKEAEDRASAAQDKGKADLEADVEVARGSAEAQHQALRESAAASKGKISEWWNDLEERWNKAVADKFEAEGTTAVGGSPEDMMQVVRADVARWKRVAEMAKVRIE